MLLSVRCTVFRAVP